MHMKTVRSLYDYFSCLESPVM